MSGNTLMPSVRSENLIIETLGAEVLVYDLNNHQASCLNATAALVWKYADGKTTVAGIAERMSAELGARVDPQVVTYALEQMYHKQLLTGPLEMVLSQKRMTRRDFITRAGLVGAAIAVPVILSIAAPKPAMAATCVSSGQPCTANGQCCSNSCNGGFTCN